jgi:hypothetical protein
MMSDMNWSGGGTVIDLLRKLSGFVILLVEETGAAQHVKGE